MTRPSTQPREEQTFDALRLNALSDGLFAIVLTLLVLDIRLPEGVGEAASVAELLNSIIPSLSGYFITFLIAGLYWMLHLRVLESLRAVTSQVLFLNLMLLLTVGLLPFSTGALTDTNALGYPFYCANMILIGLTQAALWGYASAAGLLTEEQNEPRHVRMVLGRTLMAPAVFALALALTSLAPTLASYMPFALIPAQFLFREPRALRRPLPRPRWAAFWRWVGLAPIAFFVLVLLFLRGR